MKSRLPGTLLLVRHAESQWNALGKWTGRTDVDLSDKGFKEAAKFGIALAKLGVRVDAAFCSEQIRTRETLECMLDAAQQFDVSVAVNGALDERDYGEYTGKNKWEMKELLGEERFDEIRRGWDVPVPGGETLRMVYERAVPFYVETVLPLLREGKNVLLMAHGNTNRALKKFIESVSDEAIADVEMPFGEIDAYRVTPEGLKADLITVSIDTTPTNA